MNSKFIPAQMQKFAVETIKLRNSQNKQAAKYISKRQTIQKPDVFVSSNKTLKPASNPVMDILTGKVFKK